MTLPYDGNYDKLQFTIQKDRRHMGRRLRYIFSTVCTVSTSSVTVKRMSKPAKLRP